MVLSREELWHAASIIASSNSIGERYSPLSSTTILVTPKAVSVVIWTGPRCLVGNPKVLSSLVLSLGGSSPEVIVVNYYHRNFWSDDTNRGCPKMLSVLEFRGVLLRTPNRNQSNPPSPSCGLSGLEAFGSNRHTRSKGTLRCFIRSRMETVCTSGEASTALAAFLLLKIWVNTIHTDQILNEITFCKLSPFSAPLRTEHEEADRWVKATVASFPANESIWEYSRRTHLGSDESGFGSSSSICSETRWEWFLGRLCDIYLSRKWAYFRSDGNQLKRWVVKSWIHLSPSISYTTIHVDICAQ
jgi:hypothetical protein